MNYVNGFLFSESRAVVALIEKQKPEWQKGKLNGVGGKIEDGETPLEAMQREFKEETGIYIEKWKEFAVIHHSGHVIHFFVSFEADGKKISSPTDEKADWYLVGELRKQPIIHNLKWLIPLALDPDGLFSTIEDKTTPWEK